MAWIVLAEMSWAWASFTPFSSLSFSTSVVILATETFALRFFWSAASCHLFPLLCLLIIAYICILVKALVMVDLLDNFLNPHKLLLAVVSNFTKSRMGAMMAKLQGVRRKRWIAVGYSRSGKRSGETAETKAFANGECYKKYLIMHSFPPA
jgi:hypothetical protein